MTASGSKAKTLCLRMWPAFAALMVLGFVADRHAAAADRQAGGCKARLTDDTPLPLPADLVARARQLFKLDMPDDRIQQSTVYRCMDGKTLLCTTGANLSCGKADTRRDLTGVADWCREHPNAATVPMFVTGHDTIYRWRCLGARPRIAATTETVDSRGFITQHWQDAGLQ